MNGLAIPDLLLNLATIYIITRVLVLEEITEKFKFWLFESHSRCLHFCFNLLSCFFCTSVWIATGSFFFLPHGQSDWRLIFVYIALVNLYHIVEARLRKPLED